MGSPYFIVDNDHIFRPFGMIINWTETVIPRMPALREEAEQIPGRDGDLLTQLTYDPRAFDFVLRTTPEYLPKSALLQLENRIKASLNKARGYPNGVELLFMRDRRTYYVSPSSTPFEIVKDYPCWFECRISLKAHDPFGYEAFDKRFRGTRNLRNIGNEDAETVVLIDGPNANPSFTAGPAIVEAGTIAPAEKYWYNGTVDSGEVLTIDSKTQTAYITGNGRERNVTGDWCGKFLVLPVGVTRVTAGFGIHVKYYNRWI